jgi:hypothetical protein
LNLTLVAYQPFTIEELREALSVTPGNIDWNVSELINDMTASLGVCGGLLVMDEEEQTVRLVHHSFKQWLLRAGYLDNLNSTGSDCERADFLLRQAHRVTAEVPTTYLNYGVFNTQISTRIETRTNMTAAPSYIVAINDRFELGQEPCAQIAQHENTAWSLRRSRYCRRSDALRSGSEHTTSSGLVR